MPWTKKTDTRGTITYGYDELNRLASRVYTGKTVSFDYDNPNVLYSRGRLTKVTSTSGTGTLTYGYDEYDALGRIKRSSQVTNGNQYLFSYAYNLAGMMTSQTYPTGRTVRTSYDTAGRVSTVSGIKPAEPYNTYASSLNYSAPRVRTPLDRYSQDASYLALDLDFSAKDIREGRETLCAVGNPRNLGSVTWLLPGFHHAYYGGIHTILRFACSFLEKRGVETQFAIVGTREIAPYRDRIIEAFPPLRRANFYPIWGREALEHMQQTEAGVATLWNTAYSLLKVQGTKRKFYFLQDFEPLFYPAGSTSAQAEATYRFGFFGIANTVGIRSIYESEYGGIAEHFEPCVDTAVFYPSVSPPAAIPQVFFYGRPDHPRNAFELASAAVRRIKEQSGKRVRIVSAGSDWSPEHYGLQGMVENFGLLSLEQSAELYRSSTVGLLLMLTRHPSYIPFELMACGCSVVTNQNPATRWFFEDKVNCVVAAPSATCLSQAVVDLLNDEKRRSGIVAAAQARIMERHCDWEAQIEKIYRFMCDPLAGRPSEERIAPVTERRGVQL